jgi:two-component system phosphate regulon sensor histidine kinase PhoR
MKRQTHRSFILPYILILVGSIILSAVIIPPAVRATYAQAAESGLPPDFKLIYMAVGAVALTAVAAAVVASGIYSRRNLNVIKQLTETVRGLGEGKYHNVAIPRQVESMPEMQVLSQALEETAAQIERQISALSKEQAMLSTVLRQMTDGVLIADHEGRVQLLNAAAERLFNFDSADALGRSVVEVMRYHQLVDFWTTVQEGEPKLMTLEMGAEHKFLQVIGIPLGEQQPGRTKPLFQDLTQLHRLEVVRKDFISNISHELRTPMASLKALSETLLGGALEDPPAARRFIERMDTEVDNLTFLVNELLELSRIEAGRTNLEIQRVNPCELMIKPYERMMLQAERAGLSLSMDCNWDLPAVFADPDRIAQVFINLLHNAIKFTPPGGHIQMGAWVHDNTVVFMVRDNGVGIPQKDLTRIFERFYKADRARSGGGTGLGLSICKHMVEAHGGYIWAESEEGRGSSLFFAIPIAST